MFINFHFIFPKNELSLWEEFKIHIVLTELLIFLEKLKQYKKRYRAIKKMKAAGVKAIKEELKNRDREELSELCLSLSKFKKENKELLTYLLLKLMMKTIL